MGLASFPRYVVHGMRRLDQRFSLGGFFSPIDSNHPRQSSPTQSLPLTHSYKQGVVQPGFMPSNTGVKRQAIPHMHSMTIQSDDHTINRPYNQPTIQSNDHTIKRPYNQTTIQPYQHTQYPPPNYHPNIIRRSDGHATQHGASCVQRHDDSQIHANRI